MLIKIPEAVVVTGIENALGRSKGKVFGVLSVVSVSCEPVSKISTHMKQS